MQYQNFVGNPNLGDTAHYFRPVPLGAQLTSPLLPPNWGGGDFGTENTNNPVVPVNSDGHRVEFPRHFTFKAPMYLHVDSNNRDVAAYPNPAFFRLNFLFLSKESTVSRCSVSLPQSDPAPTKPLHLVVERPPDGTKFVPQSQGNLGIYTPLITQNQAANQPMNTVSKYAIAKCTTTPQAGSMLAQSELRQVKYFNPVRTSLIVWSSRWHIPTAHPSYLKKTASGVPHSK
jgi:hypothetical protein